MFVMVNGSYRFIGTHLNLYNCRNVLGNCLSHLPKQIVLTVDMA